MLLASDEKHVKRGQRHLGRHWERSWITEEVLRSLPYAWTLKFLFGFCSFKLGVLVLTVQNNLAVKRTPNMSSTFINSSFIETGKSSIKSLGWIGKLAVMKLWGKDYHWKLQHRQPESCFIRPGKRQFIITARFLFLSHGCQEDEMSTEDVSVLGGEKDI